MYHDGKCYVWIPTAFTLSRISAESAALINGVHAAINASKGMSLKVDYVAGDVHEYYLSLNDLDMGGAPFTRDVIPGMAVCGPIDNTSYLTIPYDELICSFGGDVEGLPVWFEISDINASVPDPWQALDPKRTTWATWGTFSESHKPTKIGTKWYRSNAVGQSGQLLDASQFVNLGLTILTKAEYRAIQPVMVP